MQVVGPTSLRVPSTKTIVINVSDSCYFKYDPKISVVKTLKDEEIRLPNLEFKKEGRNTVMRFNPRETFSGEVFWYTIELANKFEESFKMIKRMDVVRPIIEVEPRPPAGLSKLQ